MVLVLVAVAVEAVPASATLTTRLRNRWTYSVGCIWGNIRLERLQNEVRLLGD